MVDHAVALYRSNWRPLITLSAVWFVPTYGLPLIPIIPMLSDPTLLFRQTIRRSGAEYVDQRVVDPVAYACLGGAMTVATLDLLAGRHARVVRASVAALRRVVPLSVTYFIYVTAVVALIVVCFSADRSGH